MDQKAYLKFIGQFYQSHIATQNWKWQNKAVNLGLAGGFFMDRFEKVYSQGIIDVIEIWVDTGQMSTLNYKKP